ncbi:hypothetical protein WN943_011256 [Citrus x changshan-huyou]
MVSEAAFIRGSQVLGIIPRALKPLGSSSDSSTGEERSCNTRGTYHTSILGPSAHPPETHRYPTEIPDAYERLVLDAIEGEWRLFIRSDKLDAAWALFTPLLKELEEKKIVPELYPYGSRGPVGAHYLAAKYNVRWGDLSGEDS